MCCEEAHAITAIHKGHSSRLLVDEDLRPRVNQAFLDPMDIHRHARNTVGVESAKIGLYQILRHDISIFRTKSCGAKNACGKLT